MARFNELPVEIVDEICALIDAAEFRGVRLICRELAAKSHDAFVRQHVQVAHVNVDEDGFARLMRLSTCEELAPLMQTLHLYPSVLCTEFDQDLLTMQFMRTPQGSQFQTKYHASAYLYGQGPRYNPRHGVQAQQTHAARVCRQILFLKNPNLAWTMLAQAMAKLPNITELTVDAQVRKERFDDYTGQVLSGHRHPSSLGNTDRTLAMVLQALGSSTIRELKVGRPDDSIGKSAFQSNKASIKALQQLQKSIRSLEVCLGLPEDTTDIEPSSEFLSDAAELEELTLSGHLSMSDVSSTFNSNLRMLKRLELRTCYVDPGVFHKFVVVHLMTLTSIVLRYVVIWTKQWHDTIDTLASDDMGLEALVLECIRACSSSRDFGYLVFKDAQQGDCHFCGQTQERSVVPCRHARFSACKRDEFIELRQKLLQTEYRRV